jgi:hypothetical protein
MWRGAWTVVGVSGGKTDIVKGEDEAVWALGRSSSSAVHECGCCRGTWSLLGKSECCGVITHSVHK